MTSIEARTVQQSRAAAVAAFVRSAARVASSLALPAASRVLFALRAVPAPGWLRAILARRRARKNVTAYVIAESSITDEVTARRVKAVGARARNARHARRRIEMCALAFAIVFALLCVRLLKVSMEGFSPAQRVAYAHAARVERPEIVDRNGVLLATNLPMRALEIAGRNVWDARETAVKIAGVLTDIDAVALEKKLAAGRYVEVRRKLTPSQEKAIFALGLPGVRFADRVRRLYPQNALAAHLIGHAAPGRGGVAGLEHHLDTSGLAAAASSGPMVASIDARVQQIVEGELAAATALHRAEAAWAAVMDVATGEVLALASFPEFDPNAPGAAETDHRRNRAVYDRYEFGSVFKAFTGAAALEAGVASEAAVYDARKPLRVADWTIRDYHGKNRELSFGEVIEHSSNIGAAMMAADLGPRRQKAMLEKLGLLDPLPIELKEARAPQPPAKWGPVEAATVSYGHGVSVTALHVLSAFSAVVNGGAYRAPTFLKATTPREGARVFSAETSAIMRRVLRQVVLTGTAKQAETPGYLPIGKTGTADKPAPAGGYIRNARISSFVGAFPGPAPRYAVIVSLDNPKPLPHAFGYATAGWNAAPTFANIVRRIAPALQVVPVPEIMAPEVMAPDIAPSDEHEDAVNWTPQKDASGPARAASLDMLLPRSPSLAAQPSGEAG